MEGTTGGTGAPPTYTQPPQHPPEAPTAPTVVFRGLLDGLVALVPTGQQGTARGLAKEIQGLFVAIEKKSQLLGGSEVLTVTHLQRVVTEAVRAAVGPNQGLAQGRSWATVAAGATGGSGLAQPNHPTKTILQRINRETLIKGADLLAELAKRTPAEIIQAIN